MRGRALSRNDQRYRDGRHPDDAAPEKAWKGQLQHAQGVVNCDCLPLKSPVDKSKTELLQQNIDGSIGQIEHCVPPDLDPWKEKSDPMTKILVCHRKHTARPETGHEFFE